MYFYSIYHSLMVLENTNVTGTVCNSLDVCISLNDDNFSYKSYDKREDYAFDVIIYPNLSGNISHVAQRTMIPSHSVNDMLK